MAPRAAKTYMARLLHEGAKRIARLRIISKALVISISLLGFPISVFAEDVTLTADETINIVLGSATLSISSTTGIDSIVINETTERATASLASGDNLTVTSSGRLIIENNLTPELGTNCGQSSSTITFTESVTFWPGSSCPATTGGGGGAAGSSGGGGGGAPTVIKPSNLSLSINSGATQTTKNQVTLTLSATNANLMLLSNDANFLGASWQQYKTSFEWNLTSGFGKKTVYAKFRSSAGGDSDVISKSIDVVERITETAPTTTPSTAPGPSAAPAPPTAPISGAIPEGALVKEAGNAAVYLLKDGKLLPFLNDRIFHGYGYSFDSVVERDLGTYEKGDLIQTFPDNYDFTCGQLVKATNAKVYIVSACDEAGQRDEISWIETESAFLALGFSFKNLNLISDEKKSNYIEGASFNRSDIHPAGSLVKYSGDSKVYLLQKVDDVLKKRHIVDEYTFNQYKFQWNDVVTIPAAEVYSDGNLLSATGAVLGVEYEGKFVSFLNVGSKGDEVKLLQNVLKKLGYFPANQEITGFYGSLTKKAVADFQKANGIDAVGYVGPKTRETLNKHLK